MGKTYYVYILANKKNGTLYVGITSDLIKRVWQHRNSSGKSFTKRYNITRLVYFESFGDVELAIHREKRLKEWKRSWKVALIEKANREWQDLYPRILGCGASA